MDAPVRLFVTCDGDGIGRKVGQAVLRNAPEELARISQAIEAGQGVIKSWALAAGGSVLEAGGDEVTVEVPAAALADLPAVRLTYASATGCTLSVGVGKQLDQAAKALMVAKLRGKDRVVLFDDNVAKEYAAEAEKPKDEQTKLQEEYLAGLNKADEGSGGATPGHGRGVSVPHKSAPSRQTEEHSEGEVARKQAEMPKLELGPHPAETHFRAIADSTAQQDAAKQVRNSEDFQKVKEQVAAALQGIKAQLPVLAQVKSAYPEAYKAILQLTQSVVTMARGLQQEDQQLAKKERAGRVFRTPGFGPGTSVSIPGLGHPSRAAWEQGIRDNIARYYARGDAKALKDHKLDLGSIVAGGNSAGAANPDRLRLYRRIFRSGDVPHPVVVTPHEGGYRLLDGTHRTEAARAEGIKHVPAIVVPRAVQKNDDLLPGGPADHMSPGAFDAEQLALGMTHELEHTDDPQLAREIAMDHLAEDPDYYRHLGTEEPAEEHPDVVHPDQGELNPSAPGEPHPDALGKAGQPMSATQKARHAHRAHRGMPLPVGTIHNGEVKVQHADGKKSWKGVRAGMIQGLEADAPMLGANSHPVSSREPGSK